MRDPIRLRITRTLIIPCGMMIAVCTGCLGERYENVPAADLGLWDDPEDSSSDNEQGRPRFIGNRQTWSQGGSLPIRGSLPGYRGSLPTRGSLPLISPGGSLPVRGSLPLPPRGSLPNR